MELEVGAYIRYICVELGYNYITDIYMSDVGYRLLRSID